MTDRAADRARMAASQLAGRDIRDARVLAAMGDVPREAFVPPEWASAAYQDGPLPIAEGQTISQPYVVALMIQAARVRPGDRVLEVGAGSGYAAAVLGRVAARVWSIERHASLAAAAAQRLRALGAANVEIVAGDGTRGLPEHAPFDAILVAAAGPDAPDALRRQLRIGGRLVIPVGDRSRQSLLRIVRAGEEDWTTENLGPVMFVPLVEGRP